MRFTEDKMLFESIVGELWMMSPEELEWDTKRNCYVKYYVHFAFQAFVEGRKSSTTKPDMKSYNSFLNYIKSEINDLVKSDSNVIGVEQNEVNIRLFLDDNIQRCIDFRYYQYEMFIDNIKFERFSDFMKHYIPNIVSVDTFTYTTSNGEICDFDPIDLILYNRKTQDIK